MEQKIHPKIKEYQEKQEESRVEVPKANLVTLKIKKYNPNKDSSSSYQSYQVPVEKWTTVLDALLDVKQNLDHSIGVRCCIQASRRKGSSWS